MSKTRPFAEGNNLQQTVYMSFHPKYFSLTQSTWLVLIFPCVVSTHRLIRFRIETNLALGGCLFYSVKNSLFLPFPFHGVGLLESRVACLNDYATDLLGGWTAV